MHSLDDTNGNTTNRERGASILIFALFVPVLFGSIALAIDFGQLLYQRHHLSSALDAASLAGVASLPGDPAAAQSAALSYASANGAGTVPTVKLWCVVASTGATKTVANGQVPGLCNPGPLPIAGTKCGETICAIPCIAGSGHTCNSMTVTGSVDVPFTFAPVIGLAETGNTGSLSSDACRGPCGTGSPNPMNIAIVADRTLSMSSSELSSLKTGIQSTLPTMTKSQQYVALGTIGRSNPTSGCITNPSGSHTSGPWMPVPFSNDYITDASPPALNTSSDLVKGLQCLNHSFTDTYLASPMKAAARYVLGLDANNLGSLPTREGTPRNAILLETDGQPNEDTFAGSTSVDVSGHIGSSNGNTACNNFKEVATDAKARGILVVTVGYDLAAKLCGGWGSQYVQDVLAASASPKSPGVPSTSNGCSDSTLIAAENSDGDYFYCAASGTDLSPLFVSAINAISGSNRLIRIPD